MMRTVVVLEALVDLLSTYLTQLLAWEYFIGCKNCYVTELQSDVCMFIHKAQNTVAYQEFVLLSPRPKYNMIHRQKNGRSRQLSYNKLNTWVRKVALPKLKVTGISFRVFKPWGIDRQVHITFGYENPRLVYLLFREDEIIENIQIHSEVYGIIQKYSFIQKYTEALSNAQAFMMYLSVW
jgi:hypothetical protein